MIVRAIHFGFDVPDTDGALATLYYPADEQRVDEARLAGAVPADASKAPWPVVIIVPGINVAPDGYRWLAAKLVHAGYCAVTYAAIGSLGPAGRGITPGIDMAALAPDVAGTRCSASAIGPLLEALVGLDPASPPVGLLDFDRVVMGGHSAGGTVALHNSDPTWIPGLQAVFAYGAHTMTATALGHGEASVVKIPSGVPVLLLTGADDAVIAASRDRYRSDDADHDPVQRTFDEALTRDDQDSWLVALRYGNHFSLCDPVDETSGRSFLEPDLRVDDGAVRDLLAQLVVAFLDGVFHEDAGFDEMAQLAELPGVARWARR